MLLRPKAAMILSPPMVEGGAISARRALIVSPSAIGCGGIIAALAAIIVPLMWHICALLVAVYSPKGCYIVPNSGPIRAQ